MADQSSLSARFARLTTFARSKSKDDEDLGEDMGSSSIAGGGHAARSSEITKNQLRVSPALRSFLVAKGTLAEEQAGLESTEQGPALKEMVDRPHINVPAELIDRRHPLPEYFISSSHNTYLMRHQLYGTSSAAAYETALLAGARCVEMDAWDNEEDKDEPKITHGYTLVSHISFRSACEAIRDMANREAEVAAQQPGHSATPIFISLENHCGAHSQLRMVHIMKEVWGDLLLDKAIREKGHGEQEGSGEHVTLEELGSKIVVIVEYHLGTETESDNESSTDETEEEKQARQAYKEQKKNAPPSIIIPELAAMGVYSQSIKPVDNSWYEDHVGPENLPHHHLINVSESGLGSHMPADSDKIAKHNSMHLMRVYPMGTRISSRNLNPVAFWGIGAQICALNWQTFDASMQLNEALFSGSDGYVLKPAALRLGGNGKLSTGRMKRLRLHIAGASDVPAPAGREADSIKPYVTCSLIHPDHLGTAPPKRKTGQYKQHKLDFLHNGENPPVNDPIWDETLEWEYEDNELTFLRILIKSDDKFATNPKLAVAAVRLSYAVRDWSFVRMLDLAGRETKCLLLIKFDIDDR